MNDQDPDPPAIGVSFETEDTGNPLNVTQAENQVAV